MGKLQLVVETVPVVSRQREIKNADLYPEIAEAFDSLEMNQCFTIGKDTISLSTLETKIRDMVKLKEGERLKISKITGDDGKINALRLSKVAAPQPKAPAEPQGEVKAPEVEG